MGVKRNGGGGSLIGDKLRFSRITYIGPTAYLVIIPLNYNLSILHFRFQKIHRKLNVVERRVAALTLNY